MNRLLLSLAAVSALAAPMALVGCGKTVKREDPNSVRDLSGNWNDVDSKLVAEKLVADSLRSPWADNFTKAKGRIPVVKVGRVTARTNGDAIATEIFTNDMTRAIINSGKADVVAGASDVEQTRAERTDQDKNASEATRKESFQEVGADFLLTGVINVQDDQEGDEKVKFYSVDLKLVEIQTQRQAWLGNEKIKKFVKR